MENKGPSLLSVNFADDKLPKFTEGKSDNDWVLFGERNDYPLHLIDLFNRSGKHNAIITGVADMIKGDGFKIDGVTTPALTKWIDYINPHENANDVLEKVALDLKLQGGFYLQVLWSRDGTRIAEQYHLPFEEMRMNAKRTKFFRYHKWGLGVKKSEVEVFDAFNTKNANRALKPQVFFYGQYRPGLKTYPLPDYIGARQYVEVDTEICNFHYNNIKHAFSNGTIITFTNGEPETEEKKAEIVRKIKGQKTGTDNAGGIVVNFVDRADQAPIISRMQPDEFDKSYLSLYTCVTDEIFIGHRITNPSIFGVKVAGQLGTRQDLLDSKELFYTDYVKGKVAVIERCFNFFMDWISPGSKVIIEKANSQDNAGATDAANSTMPAGQPKQMPQQIQQAKQLTEDDILLLFDGCGEPETNYRVIKSKRLRFGTEPEEDEEIINGFQIAVYLLNNELSEIQKKILETIKENPELTIADISNITKDTPEEVNKAILNMVAMGVVTISATAGIISITDKWLKYIDEKNLLSTEIFVKYKYTGPQDSKNRPFCAKVLGLGKLYSRDDIDNVSNAAGYNVWTQRGGWYHNPKTDVNTPYCRHFWSQVIVKRKVRQ